MTSRIIASVVALVCGLLATPVVLHTIRAVDWFAGVMAVTLLAAATLCAMFAITRRGSSARRRIRVGFIGGAIGGGTGLVLGFYGPLLLSSSNQEPLLGLFFTGPIGFVLGAAVGLVFRTQRGKALPDPGSAKPIGTAGRSFAEPTARGHEGREGLGPVKR